MTERQLQFRVGLFAICAMGIMAALIEREKSGKGQWVTSSLLQSQIFMLDFQAARWLMEGELAAPVGNAQNLRMNITAKTYRYKDEDV